MKAVDEALPVRVVVLTISDSSWRKERTDLSGPAVSEEISRLGFQLAGSEILPDESEMIRERLSVIADELRPDIIFTTGGTGLGPRDCTPEATTQVIERPVPGLAELMRQEGRKSTPRAALSRAIVGVRGKTLIINLPGSLRGARQSVQAIEELLPHAVELIRGIPVRCGG
jgi:molybdenum cofactor synthesis domain-containing protein